MTRPHRRTTDSMTPEPSYIPEITMVDASDLHSHRSHSRFQGPYAAAPLRDAPPAPMKSTHTLKFEIEEPDKVVSQLRICESCELEDSAVGYCSYCDMTFCDGCWARQGPHQAGRTGPDGLPHEKADPTIFKNLRDFLTHLQENI